MARTHGTTNPLVYMRPDKHGNIVRHEEYRDAAELARLAGRLPGKPLIVLHPKNKKNLKRGGVAKIVGRIARARVDGDHVVVGVKFTHPDADRAVANGIRELSLGYDAKLDQAGFQHEIDPDHLALVPIARCGPTCELRVDAEDDAEGEAQCQCSRDDGDLSAKERHHLPSSDFAVPSTEGLPIEDEGHLRAAMARFNQEHFPSSDARSAARRRILARAKELGVDASGFAKEHQDQCSTGTTCKGCAMCQGGQYTESRTTMDELTKQLTKALEDAAAHKARADQAEKDRDAQRTRADAAEAKATEFEVKAKNAEKDVATERTRADQAETKAQEAADKARHDADEAFDSRVNQRVTLLSSATPIIGKDAKGEQVDISKMPDRAIKVAVIQRVDAEDVPDGKPDAYVDGVFDGALKCHAAAKGQRAEVRQAIKNGRQDAAQRPTTGRAAEDDARKRMNERTAARSTRK